MKKPWFLEILVSVVLVVFLSFTGCDLSGSDDDDEGGGGTTYSVLYDAAKEILPSYGGAAASALSKSFTPKATWSLGNAIYELYGVLEDDTSLQIGYFNIYDTLRNADERFTSVMNYGNNIQEVSQEGPQMKTLTAKNYNRYQKYTDDASGYSAQTFAKQDGTQISFLYAITQDGKNKSVIQAEFDETTKNVKFEIFMANYADNTAWETVRVYAEGNTDTHIFRVKIIRNGYGYDHNILGAGVSQGTGYFLLKLANNSMDIATAKYYKIDSGATTDSLKLLDDAGYADAASAGGDPDGHDTTLGTLTAYTSSDLPADDDAVLAIDLTMPEPTVIQ